MINHVVHVWWFTKWKLVPFEVNTTSTIKLGLWEHLVFKHLRTHVPHGAFLYTFSYFFIYTLLCRKKCRCTPQVMLFQSLACMLMIMAIDALSTLAVVSRCSWMWCIMFAGSRSTPHEGKRLQCATSWKMASISATLDFSGVIAPSLIPTMVCSFRWLKLLHLMMLMLPGGHNFITFVSGTMWLLLEWPNIVLHQLMRNIQERRKKYV